MDQGSSTIWLTDYESSTGQQQINNNQPNQRPTGEVQPFSPPAFSSIKFLAVFTTSHLTISLLFVGLIVLLFAILSLVVSKLLYATSDPLAGQAFHIIGISCICLSIILIVIALGIMIMAIRWARRKIYCLPQQKQHSNQHQQIQFKHHHHHHHYPSITSLSSNHHQQSTPNETPNKLNFFTPSAPSSESIIEH